MMSVDRCRSEQIFVYRHPVDFRKQIDGLSAVVAAQLDREPMDGSLYVFINRCRDKIKLLIWHRNGFWILYKRLQKQRFKWPDWFSAWCYRTIAPFARLRSLPDDSHAKQSRRPLTNPPVK